MKVTPLRDILRMEKDDTVEATKGTIEKIKDQKPVGKRGTLQSIVLKDGRDELLVKLWDREEITRTWRNKFIHIVAGKRDNDTDFLKVDEYKRELQLSVPKTAEITLGADLRDDDRRDDRRDERRERRDDRREDDEPRKRRDEGSESEHARPASKVAEEFNPDDPKQALKNILETKFYLGRCANLYLMVLRAADYVAHEYEKTHGKPLDQDLFKAMTHGFFINGERKGLIPIMPKGDLNTYLDKLAELKQKQSATTTSTPATETRNDDSVKIVRRTAGRRLKKDQIEKTVQQRVADLVLEGEFNFDEFMQWGVESGNVTQKNITSFDELSDETARHIEKNIVAVLKELNAFFEAPQA